MKIIYNENPLRTVVELDEHDRQVFWLKIKIEELQNRLFSVYFSLTENTGIDISRACFESNPEDYIKEDDQEKTKLDERVDMLFESYVKELQDTHVGDCTCVPCSCMKCCAENILGIDTLKPYPGKHELAKIDAAFSHDRSLIEALAYLKKDNIFRIKPESWKHTSQEEYESHIPRWEQEQARAYEYLKCYAEEYFE